MKDKNHPSPAKTNYLPLVVVVLAAVLLITAVLVSGLRTYGTTEEAFIEQSNHERLILAKDSARGMSQFLDTIDDVMHVVANDPQIRNLDESESRELLPLAYNELKIEGAINVGIIGADGAFLYGVTDPSREGTNVGFRQFFKDAKELDDDGIAVELIDIKGKFEGRRGLAVAVPIFRDQDGGQSKEFAGVLHTVINLEVLNEAFLSPLQSRDQHVMMVDKTGQILFWPDKSFIYKDAFDVSKDFPDLDRTIRSMMKGGSGTGSFFYKGYDHDKLEFVGGEEEYLYAFSPVDFEGKHLFIAVFAHKQDVLQSLRSVFISFVAVIGIIIFVIFLSSVVVFTSIFRTTAGIRRSEENFRRIASTLQESLIRPVPDIPELDIWVGYESAFEAEKVGGDFYDIFKIEDDKVMLLIGDVAGKGVEAAGYTETVRSSVRSFAQINPSPAFILTETNKLLLSQSGGEGFVTGILGSLTITTGELIFTCAGHPPPVKIAASPVYLESVHNLPLGVAADTEFAEEHHRFRPGEGVVLFTDGLTDVRRGSEFFGFERILEIVKNNEDAGSRKMVENLLFHAAEFGYGKLTDDVAVVSIKIRGKDRG